MVSLWSHWLLQEKWNEAESDENEKIARYENEINSYVDGNRDSITLSKEEYQNLINRIEKLESNNFSNFTPLCGFEHSTEITVEGGINQYKYLYLQHGCSSGEIMNSCIIPVDEFVNNYNSSSKLSLYYNTGSGYYGSFYYDATTAKIYASSSRSGGTVRVCGIK